MNFLALKESVTDTAAGFIINFPLNIILLTIAAKMALTVLQTSVVLAVALTVVAILRKYIIRCYFSKKTCCNTNK